MPDLNELDDVFISLELMIKLNTAAEQGAIIKEVIDDDIPLVVRDQNNNLFIKANLLNSNDDFIIWTQNNIMTAFGIAAVTLWEAVKTKGVYNENKLRQLKCISTDLEMAVSIAYMIRCCFAHGMTRPIWRITNNKYKIIFRKWNKIIDLNTLTGVAFNYDQIGGYETLWFLKSFLKKECIL
jgi:hypothetical protein